MKIRLKQVIEAIEMADDAYTAFWDRQTGETVFLDDPDITGMRNNELEALLDDFSNSRQNMKSTNTALWNPLWKNCPPEKHEMSLPEQSEAGEPSAGSKMGSGILASNSSGTIILRKPIGKSPYVGAGITG